MKSERPLKGRDVKKVKLGNCEIRLMRQRDLVDFAKKWIEENRR